MTKISDGDISNAVKILSSDDSLAAFNLPVLTELQNKHPSAHPSHNEFPEAPNQCSFTVSENEVSSAVISFNMGSAGGLDSLRPSHLRDLLSFSSGAAGKNLLRSLTNLCNFMLAGKVNPEICPILYGASLIALKKKDGSSRPIAIGSFLRRLVAKLCCFKIKNFLGDKFRPVQFGFGSPGGCEAVAHAARVYLFNNQENNDKVFLKIDYKNAFNMIRRDSMLQAVAENTPELFAFLDQCYRNPSFLLYGNNLINSARGVQQGDPLGPALFCLTINNLTRSISPEFNCWYLDDGSIGGNVNAVLSTFGYLIKESSKVGLEINFNKCELFFPSSADRDSVSKFSLLAPGIRVLNKNQLRLLGAPLTVEALHDCISEKSKSLSLLCSRLDILPSHVAFFILKNCLAIPKLTYILRCSPCWLYEDGLSKIDTIIRQSLENITNNRLTESSWSLATLPISRGGLGIRSAVSLALPCFLSSFSSVKSSIGSILPKSFHFPSDPFFDEGEKLWTSLSKSHVSPEKSHKQKAWDSPLVDLTWEKLFKSAKTNPDKARLKAISSPESSSWLNALPAAPLGTLLDDFSFRVCIGLRLGCSICVPHKCICGSQVDELGTHGLSCVFSAGRLSRHHSVNDIIKRALTSAGTPSILEPPGTCRDDGRRPDGMTLMPWRSGKPLVWDFTCVDTTASSHLASTSCEAGAAALSAEKSKTSKYRNLLSDFIFLPVAVETFGSWGPQGSHFIKQIGDQISKLTGDNNSGTYLFQRISVAIQRGNAASICGTFPASQALDELFLI